MSTEGQILRVIKKSRFLTNILLYLRNNTTYSHSYYGMLIENHAELLKGTIFNDLE